jgi:tetrahydromethanopterin S-methyltransferase subunit G
MALTKEDLDAIKTIVEATVQASAQRLKSEMDKRFELVDKQFEQVHNRFDQVDKGMDNIVQEMVKTMGELHEDHEERIKVLERELHIP